MNRLRETLARIRQNNAVEKGAEFLSALLEEAADELEQNLTFTLPAPRGCICPGDATETCKSFSCPRKGISLAASPLCGMTLTRPATLPGTPHETRFTLPDFGPSDIKTDQHAFMDKVV